MRGFFGIGVEGIHKGGNVGNLLRTSHAFGASFFFTIAPAINVEDIRQEIRMADTSGSGDHLPYYEFSDVESMKLPEGTQIVGVELVDEAVELPSFRHPTRAVYLFGPEMGNLSPEALAKCDHVVKIPTKFCVNVGIAGALVIYDRMICLGRHAERPVMAGGPLAPRDKPLHGKMRKVGKRWVKLSEIS